MKKWTVCAGISGRFPQVMQGEENQFSDLIKAINNILLNDNIITLITIQEIINEYPNGRERWLSCLALVFYWRDIVRTSEDVENSKTKIFEILIPVASCGEMP